MIEITTNNSTNVKDASFLFGIFSRRDKFIIMTKPTIAHLCEKKKHPNSFTLVELLAVITIIGILAGLTLGAAGAVRRHSSASQAKAEISALQAACERYFAEQNAYPANTATDPNTAFDPKAYEPKSSQPNVAVLFVNLFGASNLASAPSSKRYFEPKPNMVSSNSGGTFFMDPWGRAYGYYSDGTSAPLIWSTANQTNSNGITKWITSWPKM
jgi:prepilin-type N-terminal cleavage/methylation domain-containing protein